MSIEPHTNSDLRDQSAFTEVDDRAGVFLNSTFQDKDRALEKVNIQEST